MRIHERNVQSTDLFVSPVLKLHATLVAVSMLNGAFSRITDPAFSIITFSVPSLRHPTLRPLGTTSNRPGHGPDDFIFATYNTPGGLEP